MSRILHHVGRNDFKKTRQRQIGEQKESAAKELKERQEAETERKIIEEAAKPFKSNWRLDFLSEAMTTAGLGMLNLDATGDVDLVDLGNETPNPLVQPGAENNNGTYTFGPIDLEYGYASTLSFTQTIDLSRVDTLVFDFTAGDITNFDFVVDTPGNTSVYSLSTSSGSKLITLKQSDRTKNAILSWTVDKNRGEPVGTNRISGIALQRRTPMNVFVPLDDPEANSFIRGGLGGSEERRKKLKDMLESGNEWMTMLGLESSKTSPGDIELAQGPKGFDRKPGTYHKNLIIPIKSPGSKWKDGEGFEIPLPSTPFTGPGLSNKGDDTEVAASYPTTKTPLDKVGGYKGIPKGKSIYPMDKDGNLYNPQTGLPVKFV